MPDLRALLGDRYDDVIERAARAHALIEPGEDWPTNSELGGGLTGTRDDEYRAGMREEAEIMLAAVLPDLLAEALNQGRADGWDEGHAAGWDDYAARSDVPDLTDTPNPYRTEETDHA